MFISVKRLQKGRGTSSNPRGRFEKYQIQACEEEYEQNDWPAESSWPVSLENQSEQEQNEENQVSCKTVLHAENSKSILTQNDSPDISFEQSINPYKGCEHGCIYCFARPTHEYLGYSAGLDFETQIWYKPKAAQLLEVTLQKPNYVCKPIVLGSNTDPYQPAERKLKITRQLLEVLLSFQHPVYLISKSSLLGRDIDLFKALAQKKLVGVCISLTTLDPKLAQVLEPRAATPLRRLEVIKTLSEAGVPVIVLTSPMIPGLNDHELESLMEAAYQAGAKGAGYTLLRLPGAVENLFIEWLEQHFPQKKKHILTLLKECRTGRLSQNQFGTRMLGQGPYADLVRKRFKLAHQRLGFPGRKFSVDCSLFQPQPKIVSSQQLSFGLF